jgi:hypothetical protein
MLPLSVGALVAAGSVLLAMQGCTDSTTSTPGAADASSEGHNRVIACPPATDASIAEAKDAGIVVKITSPTDGQKFKTTDRVTFRGTGSAPDEPAITDKERMIWNIGDAVKGVNPDGEGPEDTAGPYAAGTYLLRFDVSNKACVTGADQVTITVE